MVMLDANVILRYLLNDDNKMATESENIIKTERVLITIEVVAEVVYVLRRVYSVEKNDIRDSLLALFTEVEVSEKEVLTLGLKIYADNNLDFIDCILCAYKSVRHYEIITFDKKLNKLLEKI